MKEHHVCEKDYFWNTVTCSWEYGKYLAGIIDDSVTTCNKTIEEAKTVSTKFNNKRVTYKTKKIYILLFY